MKITTQLLILVMTTIVLVVILYALLMSNRVEDNLNESQIEWVDTLVNSIGESIAQDTINGKQLQVNELLTRIVENDKAIEFAFVTDMKGKLFAHSFIDGFPRFLTLPESKRGFSEFDSVTHYKTDLGEIVEIRKPLVEGLRAELHIGLNQREIDSTIQQIYVDLSKGMLFIALIALSIVLIIGNRISRPLTQFTQQLKARDDISKIEFPDQAKLDPDTRELVTTFKKLMLDRVEAEKELQLHRNHLEELVEERTRELQVAIKELESFSYSVSHDLRSPLRGIDGFSHALLDDYADVLDEQGQEYLHRVRAGVQRMGRLIDDLLLLSRASRENLKRKPVNITKLANFTCKQLSESSPGRQVKFIIQNDMLDNGDENLLGSAIANLIENAWKYSSREDNAIIEMGYQLKAGKKVYFVKDNGIGIDMRYADKLFKPFQRLHGDEFEGTGIGLATVERIVHRHGGKAWAESEQGQGAVFYFTLSA